MIKIYFTQTKRHPGSPGYPWEKCFRYRCGSENSNARPRKPVARWREDTERRSPKSSRNVWLHVWLRVCFNVAAVPSFPSPFVFSTSCRRSSSVCSGHTTCVPARGTYSFLVAVRAPHRFSNPSTLPQNRTREKERERKRERDRRRRITSLG